MTNVAAVLYTHTDKESVMEEFEELFPDASDSALQSARGAGYEIEYNGYWTEEGDFFATHVNTVELAKAIKL